VKLSKGTGIEHYWSFTVSFIPGMMVGVEFPTEEDTPSDSEFIISWGIVIDLFILRMIFLKLIPPDDIEPTGTT
jgi:hypothetical protein